MHLIIDGYCGDSKKMRDTEFIYHFLDTYPRQIGMTKVSTPQVSQYESLNPKEQGVSGFILLAESHISIHVFPELSYVNIDIFSCNDFQSDLVISGLQQQFGLTDVKSYVLNRPHT
ncbi:S-adenosylmethionine decarboxylase [Dehalococcoidia bacterium]|nr:S-adenosylmethionine decarboxylase [Dehalococcoidia bacterium]